MRKLVLLFLLTIIPFYSISAMEDSCLNTVEQKDYSHLSSGVKSAVINIGKKVYNDKILTLAEDKREEKLNTYIFILDKIGNNYKTVPVKYEIIEVLVDYFSCKVDVIENSASNSGNNIAPVVSNDTQVIGNSPKSNCSATTIDGYRVPALNHGSSSISSTHPFNLVAWKKADGSVPKREHDIYVGEKSPLYNKATNPNKDIYITQFSCNDGVVSAHGDSSTKLIRGHFHNTTAGLSVSGYKTTKLFRGGGWEKVVKLSGNNYCEAIVECGSYTTAERTKFQKDNGYWAPQCKTFGIREGSENCYSHSNNCKNFEPGVSIYEMAQSYDNSGKLINVSGQDPFVLDGKEVMHKTKYGLTFRSECNNGDYTITNYYGTSLSEICEPQIVDGFEFKYYLPSSSNYFDVSKNIDGNTYSAKAKCQYGNISIKDESCSLEGININGYIPFDNNYNGGVIPDSGALSFINTLDSTKTAYASCKGGEIKLTEDRCYVRIPGGFEDCYFVGKKDKDSFCGNKTIYTLEENLSPIIAENGNLLYGRCSNGYGSCVTSTISADKRVSYWGGNQSDVADKVYCK